MFAFEHHVRFEDVDAAGIVFFARYLNYCHEAMEAFFAPLEGGYARLIVDGKVGLPAVQIGVEYKAPLRYGDSVRIEMTVLHIGRSSVRFRYVFVRTRDETEAAVIEHTCVVSDLTILKSVAIPPDMRALLDSHRADAAPPAVEGP